MQLFLVLALLIALLAVIFALQNIAPVTITFFVWQYTGSLALVLLLTLGLGVLITLFFSLPAMVKKRLEITNQQKSIGHLEKELREKGVTLPDIPPEEGQ